MFVQVVSSKTMWGQPPSALSVSRSDAPLVWNGHSCPLLFAFDFDFDVVNQPYVPLSFRTGCQPGEKPAFLSRAKNQQLTNHYTRSHPQKPQKFLHAPAIGIPDCAVASNNSPRRRNKIIIPGF